MKKVREAWLPCLGASICIVLLCCAIYFAPKFVETHLSPDGTLTQSTIFGINLIRLSVGILSTTGLLISALYVAKPNLFSQFYVNSLLKSVVFVFPLVFVVFALVLKSNSPFWYQELMWREDSIIEWLTFLCYSIACLISLNISIVYYRKKRTLFCTMYMMLATGFVFIAMEEISWGQRMFNVATPEILAKYNYQGEMNLHNADWFPLHWLFIIVGLYGAFARFVIPKNVKIRYRSTVDLFVPAYYLFFYFFVVGGLYVYYGVSSIAVTVFGEWVGWGEGRFMHGKDQEPAEFLLSCGFLLFVTINKWRQGGRRIVSVS